MKKRYFTIIFPVILILLTTTNNSLALNFSFDHCNWIPLAENQDNTWIVTIGGNKFEDSVELLDTSDGGYLVFGETNNFSTMDMWVIKVGIDGYIEWENTYGGQGGDYPYDIMEVDDGYVIAGYTTSFGIGDGDGLAMKINMDGSVAWQNTFGHLKTDRFSSIVKSSDNGYLLTGSSQNLNPRNDWEGLVVKLNPDGSLAWQKTYGGQESDHFYKAIQMNDGKYLLYGTTSSFGTVGINLWLVMLNSDGSISWEKTYSGQNALYDSFITDTKDGGFILAGSTYGTVSSVLSHDGYLLKLNSSGEIVWQQAYGWLYSDSISAVYETIDGDLIATGNLHKFAKTDSDAWLLKLNSEGNLIWQKMYGGDVTDNFDFGVENLDKSITLLGNTNSFGSGEYDIWMVNTDENGDIGNCDYYSDGIALPSDIGTINVTTSAASVQDSDLLYMNSTLVLNNVVLPITDICPIYSVLYTFLPLSFRNTCSNFFDDFSNPASGWFIGEDEFVRFEYLNSEYRVLTKDDRFLYLTSAPTCALENYSVEVDGRWVGTPGESYGIIFGSNFGFDEYYLFEVSSDYQDYRLLRFDGSDYHVIVNYTYSPHIKSSTASNHMKITRNGVLITLEINSNVLGTWTDTNITGATYSGIFSLPYIGYPISDARFDNFSFTQLNNMVQSPGVHSTLLAPVISHKNQKSTLHRQDYLTDSEPLIR